MNLIAIKIKHSYGLPKEKELEQVKLLVPRSPFSAFMVKDILKQPTFPFNPRLRFLYKLYNNFKEGGLNLPVLPSRNLNSDIYSVPLFNSFSSSDIEISPNKPSVSPTSTFIFDENLNSNFSSFENSIPSSPFNLSFSSTQTNSNFSVPTLNSGTSQFSFCPNQSDISTLDAYFGLQNNNSPVSYNSSHTTSYTSSPENSIIPVLITVFFKVQTQSQTIRVTPSLTCSQVIEQTPLCNSANYILVNRQGEVLPGTALIVELFNEFNPIAEIREKPFWN